MSSLSSQFDVERQRRCRYGYLGGDHLPTGKYHQTHRGHVYVSMGFGAHESGTVHIAYCLQLTNLGVHGNDPYHIFHEIVAASGCVDHAIRVGYSACWRQEEVDGAHGDDEQVNNTAFLNEIGVYHGPNDPALVVCDYGCANDAARLVLVEHCSGRNDHDRRRGRSACKKRLGGHDDPVRAGCTSAM